MSSEHQFKVGDKVRVKSTVFTEAMGMAVIVVSMFQRDIMLLAVGVAIGCVGFYMLEKDKTYG